MQRGCVIFIIAASLAILVCSVILRIFFMPAYQAKGTTRIISVIEMAINEYERDFGFYPEGQNTSITKKLLGDNARSKQYIPEDSIVVRDNRMVDLWKHPLNIIMNGKRPMVISSGKNGIYGDDDDIKAESAPQINQQPMP